MTGATESNPKPKKQTYLKGKQGERAKLQAELLGLGKKRAAFVQNAIKKSGKKDSFNQAVTSTFGAQARAGGFSGFGGK